jgi:hypothetical protein
MQARIRSYTEEVRRTHGCEIQIRVGLHSGEVVVRAISNDLHMDYSAVGQTTHLAARMEQLASPGTVRLTADTLRLSEGFVEVRSLGPMPIKGMVNTVASSNYRRNRDPDAPASRRRAWPDAVRGRQREPQQLGQRSLAEAGHGQVVVVVGEAGLGKSRSSMSSRARIGWEVGWSSRPARSYAKSDTYRPLIHLLKAHLGIQLDDVRQAREKPVGKLLTLDEAFQLALRHS